MSVLPLVEVARPDECCPPLSAEALAPQAAARLAPMFKALGDPIRLRLLSLIASAPEVCVCDLTDAFDVTGATISHHLRVLREANMVAGERRGTWVYYRIRREVLDQLGALLGPDLEPRRPADRSALISGRPDVVRLVADPLRGRIVEVLADGPATTSHLVSVTGAKQPNVSGHLKLLREAGVVRPEPRGRFTFYRLVPEAVEAGAAHLGDLAEKARTNAGAFRC